MTDEEQRRAPVLRFKGFTDDWEQRKLGELFKIKSGQTPSSHNEKNYYPPQIHWIRTGDLTNSKIMNTEKLLSQKGAQKLTLFPKNTVVIAMYGGFNQIGRTGLLTFPSTINQALAAMTPNPVINPNFLLQLLNKHIYDWRRLAASSRKDPNITKKDIENQKLDFTSLLEQKKVSKLIFLTDKIISLQQRKLNLLMKLRYSLTNKFLYQNPNYSKQKFSNIVAIHRGLTYHPTDITTRLNGVRVLRSGNIQNGKLIYHDDDIFVRKSIVKEECSLQKNDILVTAANGSSKLIGKHAMLKKDISNQAGGFMLFIRAKEPFYINALLDSNWFKKEVYKSTTGGNGALGNLKIKDLQNAAILVPSLKTQRKIGKYHLFMSETMESYELILKVLEKLKKFLLQNMFI